jgi:hypothetical protein
VKADTVNVVTAAAAGAALDPTSSTVAPATAAARARRADRARARSGRVAFWINRNLPDVERRSRSIPRY